MPGGREFPRRAARRGVARLVHSIQGMSVRTRYPRRLSARLGAGLVGALLAGALLARAPLAGATDAADGSQPIDSIERAARTVAVAQAGAGDPATVEVHALDPRLRFAACQRPLEGSLAPGLHVGARLTVEVRCDEPRWRVYLGVTLHTVEHVVVATRPLSRATVLGPDDLGVVERELGALPGGFYRRPEELYGTLTSRMVGTGEILTPALIDVPPVIRRGQQVTVIARHGALEVRQAGVALADAGLAQRVRVQTVAGPAGRPIEAVVRAPDLVEVALP